MASAYSSYFYGGAAQPAPAGQGWTNPYYNPYATKVSLYDGSQVNVAPSYGSLQKAGIWQDNQNAAAVGNPGVANLGVGAGASNPSVAGNPFSTLRNPKNPALDAATGNLLSQITGLSANPKDNQNIVKTSIKSPEMQTRINAAGKNLDADVTNNNATLKDFVTAWMGGQGTAKANAQQEANAIGQIYDTGANGLQAMLDKIAAQRNIAATQVAQNAILQAVTRNNGARLGGPSSSYLDAMLGSQVGDIAAQVAKENADLNRTNLLAVTDARTGAAGKRNALLDAAIQRMLTPVQMTQANDAANMASLGTLLNLDAANKYTEIDSPEKMLARRLGLLRDINALDLGNTFYGMQKPYEPSTAGYTRVGMPNFNPGDNGMSDLLSEIISGGFTGGNFGNNPNPANVMVPTQADQQRALADYASSPQGIADYAWAYPSLRKSTAPNTVFPTSPFNLNNAVDIPADYLSQFAGAV